MARFLVEILINAAGGPKARASFDDVGASAASAAKRIEQSGLQSERALRRTAEAAERLKDQMEETKASKGLIADLQTLNRRTQEHVTALRSGAAGLEAYIAKEREAAVAARILAAQVKAGVSAHSDHGKAIASLIRDHDRLQAELRQTQAAQGKTTADLRVFGSVADSTANALKGIVIGLIGIQSVKSYLQSAVGAMIEAEDATAQLQARLRSFGDVSGMGLDQLTEEADRLSRSLGVDDESVIQLQATLAKFGAIDTPALFNRTTMAAIDLAAATTEAGQSIEANFSQMGEALGKLATEPDEALSKITRMVGSFTDAQEKNILALAKSGDEAGALSAVLDILEQRVGGTAASLRNTMGGSLRAVNVEWENMKELLGEGLSPALRQVAEEFIAWARTAEGQRELVEIGRELGETIRVASGLAKEMAETFRDIDASGLVSLLTTITEIANVVAKIQNSDWGKFLNPLAEYNKQVVGFFKDLFSGPKELPKPELPKLDLKLDPNGQLLAERFKLGTATRKLGIDHTQLGKDMSGARDSALRLVATIREEAESKTDLVNILKQEGISQQDLIKQYREKEIAAKAEAKVQEMRAAYLKANMRFTEADAAAIRKWVTQAEKGVDAAAKWHKALAPTSLKPIEIPVRPKLVGLEVVISEIEWVVNQLGKIEEIRVQNQASIDQHNQAIYDDLMEQALYFKESLKSPEEALQDFQGRITELEKVTDSAGNVILSAAEAERLRTDAIADYLSQSLGAWESFFSYLGDAFGGVAQKIANALQSIQSGYQTGSSLGAMSSMGAGAGGGAGAIIALVIEVYKWMKSETEKSKAESYNYGASLVKGEGQDWNIAVDDAARRASLQIKKTLEALAESIGGTITSFASLEVRVRRDGQFFHAYIGNQFVGWFKDMQSAVEAAILAGLKDPKTMFSGLSDLVREGLEYILSPGTVKVDSLEELQDFMSKIKEVSDLHLGPAVSAALANVRHFDQLRDAISKLPGATAAATQGINDLNTAEASLWQNLFDAITGRQKSQAEIRAQKETELKIAIAEYNIRKSQIQQRLIMAQAELLAAKAGNILIGGGGGERGGGPRGRGGILGVAGAFAMAGTVIAKTASVVTEATTGMVGALEAEIKGLQDLLAALGDIDIPDIGDIVTGGGGRGGSSDRDQVRDFIKDKKFDLSLVGLSDYQRALKELDRTYEPLIKSAGKDNALKAELIALREKERRLIEEEQKKTLADKFNQFMGIGQDPFSLLRKGAADLIKEIEESPFGDERKLRMTERVLADLERQIERLARQQAVGLFGELIGDLEKYGADEAVLSEARKQMALLEHTLKMEHYRTEIELLRATGKLAPEVMASIDAAFAFLQGVDPSVILSGGKPPLTSAKGTGMFHGYSDTGATSSFNDALARATDLLKKYTDQGVSPLIRELRQIQTDFDEIIKTLGATPAIIQAREEAVLRAITQAMQPVKDVYDNLLKGPGSGATQAVQYSTAQMEYETLLSQFQSGNFSNIDDLAEVIQTLTDLGASQFGTSTGGYQTLRDKILAEIGPLLTGAGFSLTTLLSGGSAASSTSAIITASNDNTTKMVSATQAVAHMVDMASRRQELYLDDIATVLTQIKNKTGSGFGYG